RQAISSQHYWKQLESMMELTYEEALKVIEAMRREQDDLFDTAARDTETPWLPNNLVGVDIVSGAFDFSGGGGSGAVIYGKTPHPYSSPLQEQVGGDHYRKYPIQPAEYSSRNNLSFLAGNVVKYVTRYRDKGGAEDIYKAIHYLELILEFEYPALLANNSECKTAVKAPGAAIEPSPATLSPHLAAEAEDTTL